MCPDYSLVREIRIWIFFIMSHLSSVSSSKYPGANIQRRTLTDNIIVGVSKGFDKKLQLVGVGYRAAVEGNDLVMNLGFSHPVRMAIPEGLAVKVEENTRIIVGGYDKSAIGQFAATIKKWRPPEPYKGKGIRYMDEVVRRKEGKAGKKK